MGTDLGPSWFSPDFPTVAARREPFPDVERWQTTFVRYSLSEAATQGNGWDAGSCRRNLHNLGLAQHPLLRHHALPDNLSIHIVQAPAEFALPVKQDRRLLPCFKLRLAVQHSGPVSVPLTLRAHVLSQQDREQIASWTPPDDASGRDEKRAPTELKGTSCIRCTLEAGITGEPVGGTGKETQAQGLQNAGSILNGSGRGGLSYTHSGVLHGDNGGCGGGDIIKPEPLYGGSSYRNPSGCLELTLGGLPRCHSGPAAAPTQQQRTFRTLMNTSGLNGLSGCCNRGGGVAGNADGLGSGLHDTNRTMLCGGLAPSATVTAGGSGGGGRGAPREMASPFGTLFAANRPEPVITLASCVRINSTNSSMGGLGLECVGGCGVRPGGSADCSGAGGGDESQNAYDAAVKMLMQSSSQQQEQHQQQGAPHVMVDDQAADGGSSPGGPQNGGRLMLSTQDFEFTNLEFLKPTRMNKVYMAFTVAIHDTDLLFVVFNVPTIGICRAEQREKACKKLNIDYKLLSHIDHGVGTGTAPDRTASMQPATAPDLVPTSILPQHGSGGVGAGDLGVGGCGTGLNPSSSAAMGGAAGVGSAEASIGSQNAVSLSVARISHGQCPVIHAQQLLQRPGAHQEGIKYGPAGSGMGAHLPTDEGGFRFTVPGQQQLGSGSPPLQHLPDNDYPRLMARMNLHQQMQQQQQIQQQQIQQQLQIQQQNIQRMGDGGVMTGGGAVAMMGGGMAASNLYGRGMMKDLVSPGVGQTGMGPGGRMLSGGIVYGMGGTADFLFSGCAAGGVAHGGGMVNQVNSGCRGGGLQRAVASSSITPASGGDMGPLAAGSIGGGGGGRTSMGMGSMDTGCGGDGKGRKRDQGQKDDDINYRCAPLHHHPPPPANPELPAYTGFAGLTSSDVEMLLPAPHSRLAMRDFIFEVYDSTGLHRRLTQMDIKALLSQAGFPMNSNREHDAISPQQWDEFCSQFRSIMHTLQQVAAVWNMEDPVVISGFDMDRAGTITALAVEPAGTFICRFSMSQPGCLVLTCKVGNKHVRADNMGLLHAIIKVDDLAERRVDTWIRDYAGATHLLDVYRQKRVDKRKVFATNYTRIRLEAGEGSASGSTGAGGLL